MDYDYSNAQAEKSTYETRGYEKMNYDYSDAQEQKSTFDLIPNKSIVPVIVSIQAGDEDSPEHAMKKTKSGLWQLSLEFTVTEGDFERRKIWNRLTMGALPGVDMNDGQKKSVNIARGEIRAMLEAGRHFAPTDESEQAKASRRMETIFELEGLEFWIEVGIEKGGDKGDGTKYDDRNRVNKIIPYQPGQARASQQQLPVGQASASKPAGQKPAASATKKPSW